MARSYAYNSNVQLSTHFKVQEFKCKCGRTHNIYVDDTLVAKLETLFGKMHCTKAIISSGYRCAAHDRTVGGYGSGAHCNGQAADICFYGKDGKPISTKLVSCVAQDMGFNGIANITWDYQWIHLDVMGRIYKGNETVSYNTLTSDFYKYYGITKAQVQALTGETSTPQLSDGPVNKKDNVKKVATIVYPTKADAQITELQKILCQKGYVLERNGIFNQQTYDVCRKFTIEKYDRGPLTAWVQHRLNTLGFDAGFEDGIADPPTMNGIAAFQKHYGLGIGYLGGTDWIYLCGGTIEMR